MFPGMIPIKMRSAAAQRGNPLTQAKGKTDSQKADLLKIESDPDDGSGQL